MLSLHHITAGKPVTWFLAHDLKEAAQRALSRGFDALAAKLRGMPPPKRGITHLGAGWWLTVGGKGR